LITTLTPPAHSVNCVTRCVRRAFLLGEGDQSREEWIENRLEDLADIFAVAVSDLSVIEHREISRKIAEPQNQRTSNPKV
jgi:hypothetical protein